MTDYGIDADDPLNLMMAVLDSATQGQRVMDVLTKYGYVIVPKEPTGAMLAAAVPPKGEAVAVKIYRAMIGAR